MAANPIRLSSRVEDDNMREHGGHVGDGVVAKVLNLKSVDI
jgi:hypothetical protein